MKLAKKIILVIIFLSSITYNQVDISYLVNPSKAKQDNNVKQVRFMDTGIFLKDETNEELHQISEVGKVGKVRFIGYTHGAGKTRRSHTWY
jgi:hypothetical protein